MPKVSTCHLILDQKGKRFDVCYSSDAKEFYIRLGDAIEGLTGKRATGETQLQAEKAAQLILREYEQKARTRTKVIAVYFPCDESMNRMSYNRMDIEYVRFDFGYFVADMVQTGDEQPELLDAKGRTHSLRSGDFRIIPWTEAREAFFEQARARLQVAKQDINDFVDAAQTHPDTYLDAAIERGALLLEGPKHA